MTKGQRIKKRREELGIGQSNLAQIIGISKQSLYKYENDIVTNIPSDIIEKIARILDTTPAFIMGWEDKDAKMALEFEKYCQDLAKKKSRIEIYLDAFAKLSPESQDKVIDYIEYQIEKEKKTNAKS